MASGIAIVAPLLAASLLLLASTAHGADLPPDIARDVDLTTPEFIKTYGYPAETHEVTTSDGYILTMHRIPRPGGPPVFLQHGLFSSSFDWVLSLPGNALSFLLADAGYDVWMGNFRGNTYSQTHVNYTTSDKKFWDFSWNENGIYDLPAMIDYVLDATASKQLAYVGHSMGTTSFYVLMSSKPEYNDKVRVMFSLAPIAFMNHVTSPLLKAVAWTYRGDEWTWNALGWYEFFPSNDLMKLAGQNLCDDEAITQAICSDVLFLLVGWDTDGLNTTQFPVILSHTPAGASSKQMLHYSQEVVSGHFRQWDYGVVSNAFHYGSVSPPDYDLSQISVPVVLFYSDNDLMSSIVDVTKLNGSLANSQGMVYVNDPHFNHQDYMWGINAKAVVYDIVLDKIKNY